MQRQGAEEEGRGARVPRDDKAREWRSRRRIGFHGRVENRATSPKRKPVRRNLAAELGDTVREVGQRQIAKGSTKDWVRKAFPKEADRVIPTQSTNPITRDSTAQAGGSGIHSDTWYRSTEEEARAAKLVYAQNEAWEKAEGGYRQFEMIEANPMDIQRRQPATGDIIAGQGRTSGSKNADNGVRIEVKREGKVSDRAHQRKQSTVSGELHTTVGGR